MGNQSRAGNLSVPPTNFFGYFDSAQALADYAEVILYIKKRLHAQKSPVIVTGGSYGGMLAAWFRLKYPHIAHGALASSAPLLYFPGVTPYDAYHRVASKDFRDISESCYQTIKKSWAEINKVASEKNGLSILSKKFKTCSPLTSAGSLKSSLETLYKQSAQYDAPHSDPVKKICGAVDRHSPADDILGKISAGVVAANEGSKCYINPPSNFSEEGLGWAWQTCSDIVLAQAAGNGTMFEPEHFNLKAYGKGCKKTFGVEPRPFWATTYYGGPRVKFMWKRFGSNIIFSNGLRDPYSSGGVLEDISDSIIALNTEKGSHCLDVLKTVKSDPKWLTEQRAKEVTIIEGWISEYYAQLATI